jgi:hypothetical protein
MQKLKRAVIKEEFVELTGDYTDAIILNQFIYWSERIKDFDKFITEEKQRYQNEDIEININLTNGWMYKKADELSSETMVNLSPANMRNRIKKLVAKKWIEERSNPYIKWDKTLQYRVNLIKIAKDLFDLGYILQDYKVDISEFTNRKFEQDDSKIRNHDSKIGNHDSKIQNHESEQQYHTLLSETTLEKKTTTTAKLTDNNIMTSEVKDVVVELPKAECQIKNLQQSKSKESKPTVIISEAQEFINKFNKKHDSNLAAIPKTKKLVVNLMKEKGLEHFEECFKNFSKVIDAETKKGDIGSLEGLFIHFVKNGYNFNTHVQAVSNIPNMHNFDQREYTEADFEKYYNVGMH